MFSALIDEPPARASHRPSEARDHLGLVLRDGRREQVDQRGRVGGIGLIDVDGCLRRQPDDLLDVERRLAVVGGALDVRTGTTVDVDEVDRGAGAVTALVLPNVGCLGGVDLQHGHRLTLPEVSGAVKGGELVRRGDLVGGQGGGPVGSAVLLCRRRRARLRPTVRRHVRRQRRGTQRVAQSRVGRSVLEPGRLRRGDVVQPDHALHVRGDAGWQGRCLLVGVGDPPAGQRHPGQRDGEGLLELRRGARDGHGQAVGGDGPDGQPLGSECRLDRGDLETGGAEALSELRHGQEVPVGRRPRRGCLCGQIGQTRRVPRLERHGHAHGARGIDQPADPGITRQRRDRADLGSRAEPSGRGRRQPRHRTHRHPAHAYPTQRLSAALHGCIPSFQSSP